MWRKKDLYISSPYKVRAKASQVTPISTKRICFKLTCSSPKHGISWYNFFLQHSKIDGKFFDTPLMMRGHTCTPLDSGLACFCFDPQSMAEVMQCQAWAQLLRGLSGFASLLCALSHHGRSSTTPRPSRCEEAQASHVETEMLIHSQSPITSACHLSLVAEGLEIMKQREAIFITPCPNFLPIESWDETIKNCCFKLLCFW